MKTSRFVAWLLLIAFVVSGLLCATLLYAHSLTQNEALYAFAVISGAVFAQCAVMYVTAPIVYLVAPHNYDPESFWFRERAFERPLYRFLKVKRWKGRVPTYNPRQYNLQKKDLKQFIHFTCINEVVHEMSFFTSFIPILAGLLVGYYWCLAAFSFLFAFWHLSFVLVQRYNRPRAMRLYKRLKEKEQ